MYNATEVKKLLEKLVSIKKANQDWLDSVNHELRTAFFDNTYVNNLYDEIDIVLKFAFNNFGDRLYDDINWFLYDWRPGYNIKTETKEYKINSLEDYINYLKSEGLVS